MPGDKLLAVKQGRELFREVYRKEISEEVFCHKHFGNPNALATPYIIESKNDAPVGMRWLMKLKFCCGDSVIWGVQSSDDAVSSEAGGLLFLKMRKKTLSILKEEKIDFEYGCFYPGTAMEIAEKSGEKNVVNLYMARLYLNEKKHRWKRFDIPLPSVVRTPLLKGRRKKLQKSACNDLTVQINRKCPFSEEDYKLINGNDDLHIERTRAYYDWKTAYEKELFFITARMESKLCGFLIIKKEAEHATVIDWDAFGNNRSEVLASMLEPVCTDFQYLDIPSLNVESGEMTLFTDLGAKDMSGLWAPVCICMKPVSDNVAEIVGNPAVWKHRLIDADYFLNGE